jgi:hypothetical protein
MGLASGGAVGIGGRFRWQRRAAPVGRRERWFGWEPAKARDLRERDASSSFKALHNLFREKLLKIREFSEFRPDSALTVQNDSPQILGGLAFR